MKRAVICAAVVLAAVACKPQKPWSPYDDTSGIPNEKHKDTRPTAFAANEQIDADIGDVEAQVFINGKIFADTPNVSVNEEIDSRKQLLRATVDMTPPLPENLWSEFEIKCGRNFTGKPAVVRGRVLADDKVAGSFSTVLGDKALRNGVKVKVDLLNPFEGQVPDTFLVKIVGDLYLLDVSVDENKVNADTVTSPEHSQALRGSLIRVNVRNGASESPAIAGTGSSTTPASAESTPAPDQSTAPTDPSLTQ